MKSGTGVWAGVQDVLSCQSLEHGGRAEDWGEFVRERFGRLTQLDSGINV